MNCSELYRERNYSQLMLTHAFNDDAGSWWWWINVIGAMLFGLIGLIGNFICCFLLLRYPLSHHSYVEYLRALAFFDFITLCYEFLQALNDLTSYLFSKNFLYFHSSFVCKLHDYSKCSIILIACWTIVALTIDRCILVCSPWTKIWPNLSRRLCNAKSARQIIFLIIIISFLINIPHLIYKVWYCRPSGFQYSVVYNQKIDVNQTKQLVSKQICSCRISPSIQPDQKKFFLFWHYYIFHLLCYTLIPAIILILSNAAILKRLHAPRQIVSSQNEHLRSKLTVTLSSLSLIFLGLYIPYAIVQTLSYVLVRHYQTHCNIRLVLTILILKRLSELLNIAAYGINFFLYILGVTHYRSLAVKMLRLDQYETFAKYITTEHKSSKILTENNRRQTSIQKDYSSFKLMKITTSNDGCATSSVYMNMNLL